MPRRKKQIIAEEAPTQIPKQYNEAAKKWLWILVSTFTIIILVMWGWATKISLAAFSWNKTPEKKLIDNSKTEWDALFDNEATRIKNERLKLQLKNLVNKIVTEANSSTPATTTMDISTNTTNTPPNNSSTISNSTTL